MARAAAKTRGRRRSASDDSRDRGPVLIAAGSEIVGLMLIGVSLLATLALASYAPSDPVAEKIRLLESGAAAIV